MDKLLRQLQETSPGTSIRGLYLGGAAHADDVRAIASSAIIAEEQSRIIQDFSTDNLKLNGEKTEIVKLSRSNSHEKDCLHLLDHTVETTPQAVCLGYGLTTHQQDWAWNLTSIRPDNNSLLLAPWAVSLDTLIP